MKSKHLLFLAATVFALTVSAQQTADLRIKQGQPIDPALLAGAYTVDASELRDTSSDRPLPRRIDAGVTPANRPEGDYRIYRMSFATFDSSSSDNYNEDASYLEGAGSNVVFGDNGQVWFFNLVPTTYHAWFQGSIEGSTITFSDGKLADVPLTDGGTGELYVTPGIPNGDNLIIRGNFQFEVADNHISSADQTTWVCSWLVIDNKGYLLSMYRDYNMTLEADTELVALPTDAQPETYAITYNFTGISWYGILGQVAFSGNDVYMDGLTPDCPGSWVKGTLDDNGRITVSGDQFLGTQDGYIVDYAGGYSTNGGLDISVVDEIHLTCSPDHSLIELDDTDYAFEFNRATRSPLRIIAGVRMERYTGDVPLTPASPYMLTHTEDFGDRFVFAIDNISEDRRYLNPELIGWRVFIDGEPYTFTPTDYPVLQQATDILPMGFVAGTDFFYSSNLQGFYIYRDEWQTVDVQAIYTVGNEQRTSSSMARYDRDHGSSIVSAIQKPHRQTASPATSYSLSGCRLSAPTRGITLQRQPNGHMRKIVVR